ncbi:DUF937 domain-containing protein [Blastococcus sp. Marseille-P5729]|uniref:DUF937 domain-containing protein n=1 Tax=Blastococcus sp. Marseille-P5729 TaxID=2086582 RepID=UPI000D10F109|nr:DUF937 domain-containing protein [Blastococcus sp. Marseille-P5729]
MSDIDQLISQIPLSQVARQLGVDEPTAQEAVNAAIPALLGGLGANAQDPAGEASLMEALGQHRRADDGSPYDVDAQDTADGQKIVHHIFGSNTDQVVNQLAGARGALGSGMLAKLLPLLAPIVLQWLANKWGQRSDGGVSRTPSGGTGQAPAGFPTNPDAQRPAPQREPQQQGGGLGDLLGGLLGGGSGGGLGDLLGGLLGGGRR